MNANNFAFKCIDFVFGSFGANHFGISIIFLAYFTKQLLYPLYFNQFEQQAQKLTLEPKVSEIRRYWDYDQLSAFIETQRLYIDNGIYPWPTLAPFFAQGVIFLALYPWI